jgi:hypothetical protein
MIPESVIDNQYSKNMATINYWLREQGFIGYDRLQWRTDIINENIIYLIECGDIIAEVKWYTMGMMGREFHIPIFEFIPKYENWNGNQLRFWINRDMDSALRGLYKKYVVDKSR